MDRTVGQRIRWYVASAFIITLAPPWAAWTWIITDLFLLFVVSNSKIGSRRSDESVSNLFSWILFAITLILGLNVLNYYVTQ